jgi:aminoglycoside phosphotransferase
LGDPDAFRRRHALLVSKISTRHDRTTALFHDGEAEFAVVRRGGVAPSLESWWLPNDPHLPALRRLPSVVSGLLADSGVLIDHPTIHRLSYNPGQRASFTVEAADGQPTWTVKALKPMKSIAVAERARALAASGIGDVVLAPQIVGHDRASGAMLFTFVSGASLKDRPTADMTTTLRNAVIAAAARVHQHPCSPLPVWDVDRYLASIRQLVDDAGVALGEPDTLLATFDRVAQGLRSHVGEGRLIHGDLTLRNVVVDGTSVIGFIDWDDASIGPVERDLATLSAAFGGQSAIDDVIAVYRQATAVPVDQSLVQHYVASQQLRKLCRKIIAAANPSN